MKLLDLFCGAGGCSVGYHRAGFTDIVGVDIKPQPRYPYKFVQGDALEYVADHGHKFDMIHASPPCQAYSGVAHLGKARNGSYPDHPDLVEETRHSLKASGKPYVIENVPGAPLNNPLILCGTMFGLKVIRHRLFETNPVIWFPPAVCRHDTGGIPSAGQGVSPKGFISVCGTGGVKGMTSSEIVNYWSYAMQIDWMTRAELAQAIPPAYTEYIGKQMIKLIGQGHENMQTM